MGTTTARCSGDNGNGRHHRGNCNESSSKVAPQRREQETKEETRPAVGWGRKKTTPPDAPTRVSFFFLFSYSTNDYLPIDYMYGTKTRSRRQRQRELGGATTTGTRDQRGE